MLRILLVLENKRTFGYSCQLQTTVMILALLLLEAFYHPIFFRTYLKKLKILFNACLKYG